MLSHYILVALRNLRRDPLVALLNIATLSLGLVGFIGAYSIVGFWERAEQHFPNAERTLVVTSEWKALNTAGGAEFGSGRVPRTTPWLAQYLRTDFPELDAVARLLTLDPLSVSAGDRALRLRSSAVDAEFLEIFDLPFIAGDPRNALREPYSVVLTQEAARRLYDDESVLGQSIVIGNGYEGTVTGVLGEIPEPSHLGRSTAAPVRFDALVTRDFLDDAPPLPDGWLMQGDITYLLLPANGSLTVDKLRAELPAFTARHVAADLLDEFALQIDVVPVTDVLGMAINEALFRQETGLSVSTALVALGVLVLAVACVSFANLATAKSALRSREVGLRRAIGAKARHVAAQHLLEAGLASAAGLALTLALVASLAPAIERSTGIDIRLALASGIESSVFLALTLIAVTVAAGAYPTFVMTSVSPLAALRSGYSRTGPRGLATLLVGVQFTAAAFLLIAVTIVHLQNQRLERTGLGLGEDPLLVIENLTEITGVEQTTLRDELAVLPQVVSTTALARPPWTVQEGTMPLLSSPGETAIERTALLHIVGQGFFRAFDVPLLAGRAFDPARADDVSPYGQAWIGGAQHIVISRTLAREFGFESPAEAVGETIYMPPADGALRPQLIIGVAEDKPLLITSDRGPRPSAYLFNPELPYHVVRLPAGDVAAGLAAIDALWARLAPGAAIERRFADDYFNDAYASFARVNDAVTVLAGMALLIAATGLFAIAILVANRRVHEIGVRKTLGARTTAMALMLLGTFAKPVLVANLIAWPLAYIAAKAYLGVFLDPIELTLAPFVLCLAATAAVAWLAVGGQTLRAARMTPARVLRQE